MTLLHGLIGVGVVEVVRAADETGLLEALGQPDTPAGLAARLDLSPRVVDLLLGVLCELGYATETGGRFGAQQYLTRVDPTWEQVGTFARSGAVAPGIDISDDRGANYEESVALLARVFRDPAAELAAELALAGRVLDIGAGSGIWSLSMAARHPSTRVTTLDLEPVLPRVAATARDLGVQDQVQSRAGNYFHATWEDRFDRIVLANVLHLESESDAAALIARWADHLAPGGELVIVDFFGKPGAYEADLIRAVYRLHLGMRTEIGKPHSFEELTAWCAQAGLTDQRLISLTSTASAVSALVARR